MNTTTTTTANTTTNSTTTNNNTRHKKRFNMITRFTLATLWCYHLDIESVSFIVCSFIRVCVANKQNLNRNLVNRKKTVMRRFCLNILSSNWWRLFLSDVWFCQMDKLAFHSAQCHSRIKQFVSVFLSTSFRNRYYIPYFIMMNIRLNYWSILFGFSSMCLQLISLILHFFFRH